MIGRGIRWGAMQIATVLALGLAGCSDSDSERSVSAFATERACIMNDPALQLGAGNTLSVSGELQTESHKPDRPAAEGAAATPSVGTPSACVGNDQFRFGSGIYDTTGPIGGGDTGHADLYGNILPPQEINGIHTRLYARAFAVESPCNGKRVMFVSTDVQSISAYLHDRVIQQIAADPELSAYYGEDNVMLSGTHTHNAGGGFDPPGAPLPHVVQTGLNWVTGLLIGNLFYDDDNVRAIVDGTVQAVRRAHANLQVNEQTATIKLSSGELLNASINRSAPAYWQNPESERAKYRDVDGNDIMTDRRFRQLSFVRENGSAVGALNWFGVHPTGMGNHSEVISGDSKGYAGLRFERMMGTQYLPDGDAALSGADNFVAAFAQSTEGDTITDLFVFDANMNGNDGPLGGVPYSMRGGTDDPYEYTQPGHELGMRKATQVSGIKQLSQALKQWNEGAALSGPVDYRFYWVNFNDLEITDDTVLAGMSYPDRAEALYEGDEKATCSTGGIGIGITSGGVNGMLPGATGFACENTAPVPYETDIRLGFNGHYNGSGYIVLAGLPVPLPGLVLIGGVAPLLCAARDACQAEKPVVASTDATPLPIQIFRIGNLAILGIPWETTTMAGRRLEQTVLEALQPAGVDTVVIAGLSNAYANYMATREEYSAQMFEAAFTTAGPWQLAGAQQVSRALALSLAADGPAPDGVDAPVFDTEGAPSPITVDPAGVEFGAIVTDVDALYTQGDLVEAAFWAGYPGNDLHTMSSYVDIERMQADGSWQVIASDRDPEVLFMWRAFTNLVSSLLAYAGRSTAEISWEIPANAAPGTYRLHHRGVYRLNADEPPVPYEGYSSDFEVTGTPAECA